MILSTHHRFLPVLIKDNYVLVENKIIFFSYSHFQDNDDDETDDKTQ